jgi:hypothetical protein
MTRMEADLAIEHLRELVGTVIGAEEFEAMAAVASRREGLVFIEDEAERAYPAGIPETLDGVGLQGRPLLAPGNPAHNR